jgi:hypothetical protein
MVVLVDVAIVDVPVMATLCAVWVYCEVWLISPSRVMQTET